MSFQIGGRIKVEAEDQGGEVDLARGRFESALLDLIAKDDISDTDNDTDSDHRDRSMHDSPSLSSSTARISGNSILPTRPVRKRRRKETELRDGGFHHTYVMRMFDRSVDLAQFEESSPLYPICRAWMLNQPHNSDLNVKQEPGSPFANDNYPENDQIKGEENEDILLPPNVTSLPKPDPWSEDCNRIDPRIPLPVPRPSRQLNEVNEESHVSPALLLTQHLHRWRSIRNQWKHVSQQADNRYYKSYSILKSMLVRESEKAEAWNSLEDNKDIMDSNINS